MIPNGLCIVSNLGRIKLFVFSFFILDSLGYRIPISVVIGLISPINKSFPYAYGDWNFQKKFSLLSDCYSFL